VATPYARIVESTLNKVTERIATKRLGKPDTGNPSVRFDEGSESDGHWPCLSIRRLRPTLPLGFERGPEQRRSYVSISDVSNEEAIVKAESLRDSDSRFAALGIGLAEEELIAEFNWLGRLKTERERPMGASLSDATRVEREPQRHREILQTLR